MPSFALLLCSMASVLGTLAADAAPGRICGSVVAAGFGALALFALRRGGSLPRQLRAAAGRSASPLPRLMRKSISGSRHALIEHRTARYGATLLERNERRRRLDEHRDARARRRPARARPRTRSGPIAGYARSSFADGSNRSTTARNPGEPSEREIERERGLDARLDGAAILSRDAERDLDSARVAGARARMGARATARTARRTRCVGRRRRAVGRAFGVAAAIARRSSKRREPCTCWLPPDLHLGAVAATRSRAADAPCAAALVGVSRGDRADLGLRVVERRAAAGRARRDDGDGRTCRARVRPRDVFVERAGDRGARDRVRTPRERRDGFVRALVLVRRRDLRLRRAAGALDRSARRLARSRARSARALARDAAGRLAAGRGGLPTVHAVRDASRTSPSFRASPRRWRSAPRSLRWRGARRSRRPARTSTLGCWRGCWRWCKTSARCRPPRSR